MLEFDTGLGSRQEWEIIQRASPIPTMCGDGYVGSSNSSRLPKLPDSYLVRLQNSLECLRDYTIYMAGLMKGYLQLHVIYRGLASISKDDTAADKVVRAISKRINLLLDDIDRTWGFREPDTTSKKQDENDRSLHTSIIPGLYLLGGQ